MSNEKGARGQNGQSKSPAEDDLDIDDLREAAERAWRDRWSAPGGEPDHTASDEDDRRSRDDDDDPPDETN